MRMCSGVAWSEEDDGQSDVGRLRKALESRRPGSVLDLLCTLPRAQPQGVVFNYSTADSCLLGALVAAATGRQLADYVKTPKVRSRRESCFTSAAVSESCSLARGQLRLEKKIVSKRSPCLSVLTRPRSVFAANAPGVPAITASCWRSSWCRQMTRTFPVDSTRHREGAKAEVFAEIHPERGLIEVNSCSLTQLLVSSSTCPQDTLFQA
jgi:hypothetical protein